MVLWQRLW